MKYVVGALCIFFLPVLLLAPIIGLLVDPWAPWRFSGQTGPVAASPEVAAVPFDPAIIPVVHGGVTDAFRYQLARAAGWNPSDAITATAISIAEDGSGDPAALSPPNFDKSRDLGLWQINSGHWVACGGAEALIDPLTNARCAFSIFGPGRNWCAWSTYESSCGVGHNSAYRAYLTRAKVASEVQPLPGAA